MVRATTEAEEEEEEEENGEEVGFEAWELGGRPVAVFVIEWLKR